MSDKFRDGNIVLTHKKKNSIDYTFKILYALGMIFVVAGHCGNGGFSLFYEFFQPYGFHLGLFMFCSGYFYKTKCENNIKHYVCKKAKSLLVPMYLWNIVYAAVVILLSYKGFTIGGSVTWYKLLITPIKTGHQFIYNLGGWFVVPLFMVQIFNVIFRKLVYLIFHLLEKSMEVDKKIKEILIFCVYIFLGIVGVAIASSGRNKEWWLVLVRFMFFIPFYSLGYLYKILLESKDNLKSGIYFLIVVGIELLMIFVYKRVPTYTAAFFNDFGNMIILPYVVGFLGIAFWLRVAKILNPAIGKSKEINSIADNTYSIMINQFMGFMIVKTGYALLSKYTTFFSDFDWIKYKTDIWYYYLPRGMEQFRIVYLISGIVIPIMVQKILNKVNLVKER